MMLLDNKFELGDCVYLKTDTEQGERMITGIKVCLDGGILYSLSFGTTETQHYELEMTLDKDILKI